MYQKRSFVVKNLNLINIKMCYRKEVNSFRFTILTSSDPEVKSGARNKGFKSDLLFQETFLQFLGCEVRKAV